MIPTRQKGIHTQVLAWLSLHCSCRTCANAAVTLLMVSAVSPIEARFGVEGDVSAVNRRDKACKDICKACDDSSKMMSGEAPIVGGVDSWVNWLACGCWFTGMEGRVGGCVDA